MSILQSLLGRLMGRKPGEVIVPLVPKNDCTTRVEQGRIYRSIEFVGGPLDGHLGWIAEDELQTCTARVGVKISRALFDCLHDGESFREEIPTSIAIYDRRSGEFRYEFRGQRPISREASDATPLYLRG